VPNNFPFSLSFRAASAASNLLLTIQFVRVVRTLPVREIPFPTMLGASVPAHAGTDYARTAWCAILSRFVRKGEAIPCGGHSCPRDPIPDDVGASVLARAPLTIVILEKRSPALAQDSRRRTYAFPGYPHAPAKFGAEQAGNGTTSSP